MSAVMADLYSSSAGADACIRDRLDPVVHGDLRAPTGRPLTLEPLKWYEESGSLFFERLFEPVRPETIDCTTISYDKEHQDA